MDHLGIPRSRCRCGRCEQFAGKTSGAGSSSLDEQSQVGEKGENLLDLCLKCQCPNTNHIRSSWRSYSFTEKRFNGTAEPVRKGATQPGSFSPAGAESNATSPASPISTQPDEPCKLEEARSELETSEEGSVHTVSPDSSQHGLHSNGATSADSHDILTPCSTRISPEQSPNQQSSNSPKSPEKKRSPSPKPQVSPKPKLQPPTTPPAVPHSRPALKTFLKENDCHSNNTGNEVPSISSPESVYEQDDEPVRKPQRPSTPRAFTSTIAKLKLKEQPTPSDMLHNVQELTKSIQILNSCNSGGVFMQRISDLQASRALFFYKLGNTSQLANDDALGHTSRAIEDCKYVLQSNRSHAAALVVYGCCDLRFGGFGRAKAKLDRARTLLTKIKRAGEVYYQYAAYTPDSLIELSRDAGELAEKLGRIKRSAANYLKAGQADRALLLLNSINMQATWSTDIAILSVKALILCRKYNQAIQRCLRFQASLGKRLDSRASIAIDRLRAKCFMHQGKASKAIDVLQSSCPTGLNDTAQDELNMYRTANDLKEKGNERFKEKEFLKAAEFYSSALKYCTEFAKFSAMVYCNRAAAKGELGQYEACVADCSRAVQLFPRYIKAHLRKARAEAKLNSITSLRSSMNDYGHLLHLLKQSRESHDNAKSGITPLLVRKELKDVTAKLNERLHQPPKSPPLRKKQQEKDNATGAADARKNTEKTYTNWQQRQNEDWNEWYNKYKKSRSHQNTGRDRRYKSSGESSNNEQAANMGWTTSDGVLKDYYNLLGVEMDVSMPEVKKAYRKLALSYHPDKNQNRSERERNRLELKFKEVTEAYDILSDSSQRRRYNRLYRVRG